MGAVGLRLLLGDVFAVPDLQRSVVANPKTVEALMPRYRVDLRQTIIEAAIVIVWATDAQQAEKLALKIAEKGEKPEHGKPPGLLHWVFKDTLDGIEAVSVEAAELTSAVRFWE